MLAGAVRAIVAFGAGAMLVLIIVTFVLMLAKLFM